MRVRSQAPPYGKPYDLRECALEFALRILEVSGSLPATPEGTVVRTQMADSAPSIGANIEEADGCATKPDKRRCFVVARKEARETRYWLRIIERKWPHLVRVGPDIQEATELLNILSTIITRLT